MTTKKNLLEGILTGCRQLHEEEINISRGEVFNDNEDDVIDNAVIEPVVDPNFDENEDGMDASSYINKNVIFCNICLKPFFSDEDISESMLCPTCAASSEDLELVGKVVTPETEVPAEEEPAEEVPADEEPEEDHKEEELGESVNINVSDGETNVNVSTEGDNVSVNATEVNDTITEPITVDDTCEDGECEEDEFDYQEESFNQLFTKFLTENYKNVKSFNLVEAKLNSKGLVLEGVITFDTDKARNVTIATEAFSLKEGTSRVKASCPLFGKSKAFVIEHIVKENKITANKMNYRFRTRVNNESYDVVGKVVLESK